MAWPKLWKFLARDVVAIFILWVVVTGVALAQEATLGTRSTREAICMGQRLKLPLVATSVSGEYLIKADNPNLMGIARILGRDLSWSGDTLTLSSSVGTALTLGQKSLGGRSLPVPPRMVDEGVHVPLSALEELLDCRITVKDGARGAVYFEPTVRAVSFVDEGSKGTALVIETSLPVRRKVLHLKNPSRTVIDLVGAAPKQGLDTITHPMLGEVKIAHNQPAPSITRIVIPTPTGVTVTTPKSFNLFEHRAQVAWRAGQSPVASVPAKPTPAGKPTPAPSVTVKVPPVVVAQDPPSENPDVRPQPPTNPPPAITNSKRPLLLSADWQGQQLKLVFSQPVTYRWSRLTAGQHRYVVDFPGVIFPDKRQNLTSPVPGLEGVRIVQNMPEPNPVVRVVCDLQGPIAVTTLAGKDTELVFEFPGRNLASGGATSGAGQTEKPKPGSAMGRTICIDPGHGGSDPGAVSRAHSVTEKQVTLDISLRLATILRAEGWNVVMTRSVDRDVSYAGSSDKEELGARAGVANEQSADLFVSIHCNSSANSGVGGTSIHWYKSDDYVLAKNLENELLVATGRTHRGLIKDRFFVLAHTQMPAVLIETAFISNSAEGALLASPDYRDRIARGIAAGLRGHAAKHFPVSAAGK